MRVWVCGASTGIGQATAEHLLEEGYEVLSSGREECDVRMSGGPGVAQEWLVTEMQEKGFRPDSMVYCAGVNRLKNWYDYTGADFAHLFDVNCYSLVNMLQQLRTIDCLPTRVVVVGSDAAWRPMRTSAAYCASKAALHATVLCLARELAPHVQLNIVAPGMTEPTEMQKYVDTTVQDLRKWSRDEMFEYELRQNPMGRRAQVDEVASMIELVLQMPEYVTGSVFTINGGR